MKGRTHTLTCYSSRQNCQATRERSGRRRRRHRRRRRSRRDVSCRRRDSRLKVLVALVFIARVWPLLMSVVASLLLLLLVPLLVVFEERHCSGCHVRLVLVVAVCLAL